MNFKILNDEELIYLYRLQHNEYALNVLLEKYSIIIRSIIRKYNIKSDEYEDLLQECMKLLYECIIQYDSCYYSIFKRYFYSALNKQIWRHFKNNIDDNSRDNYLIHLQLKETGTTPEDEIALYSLVSRCQNLLTDRLFDEMDVLIFNETIADNVSDRAFASAHGVDITLVYYKKARILRFLRKRLAKEQKV